MTQGVLLPIHSASAVSRSLEDLASVVSGDVAGDPTTPVSGVASIRDASPGDIVFAETDAYLAKAERSAASAILAPRAAQYTGKALVRVDDPRAAFAEILRQFEICIDLPDGIHPTAVIADSAEIADGVRIGPHVVVGNGVRIGRNTTLLANVVISERCTLGDDCLIYPNVTLYRDTEVGARVIVHSGAVLGSDGFGYVRIGEETTKVPHVGRLVIGADVEIGANSTIDRAKTGVTLIGAQTKIDNLVHIAHNCTIGPECILVAQVGVAGSTELGRGVVMAGQTGAADHLKIGDGVTAIGRAGIIGNVEPGEQVSGYPARPHRQQMRISAALTKVPAALRQVRDLEATVAKLEERLARLEQGSQRALAG